MGSSELVWRSTKPEYFELNNIAILCSFSSRFEMPTSVISFLVSYSQLKHTHGFLARVENAVIRGLRMSRRGGD